MLGCFKLYYGKRPLPTNANIYAPDYGRVGGAEVDLVNTGVHVPLGHEHMPSLTFI